MSAKTLFISLALVLSAALVAGALWLNAYTPVIDVPDPGQQSTVTAAVQAPAARYVGREQCAGCHSDENKLWQGSHHDLAMQPATEATVLGDFDASEFTYFDVTSRFYRAGDRFMVRTDGPDGTLQDFEIKYTFGVAPLQQYLIEFPGGRLQALGIAWDTRSASEGGQRWFHLYPDEHVSHADELHWTGRNQNWNYMCAECHSTNLKKQFDADRRQFNTTWSEIDVSCEACHGPGSEHIQWANRGAGREAPDDDMGLVITLDERQDVAWEIDAETGNAVRSTPRTGKTEIELCARCHARRGVLTEDYVPGQTFLETHRPALLTERLYHADGQILDEVYVYGSFIQSKMFHAGVTCSDCHEPHSLALRTAPDQVCLQCHAADRFAATAHHFHEPGSQGAQCVACHMPETRYMVVDPRRDHSIRVPRPDLSVKLGTPNACTRCHDDQADDWAAGHVQAWYGRTATGFQDYAEALHAGRQGAPGSAALLIELLSQEEQPAIARATALSMLGRYPVPLTLQSISDSFYDADPLVRLGGLQALEVLPPNIQMKLGVHLLDDPVRAVRIEAARILVSVPEDSLDLQQRARLYAARDEYIAAQRINADRPHAQLNLGNLYSRMGRSGDAEAAYREALALDSSFAPAYMNLADLYRQTGRESAARQTFEQGLVVAPDQASLQHAYGLALVRDKQLDRAVVALARAVELEPENARFAYVYAVALEASGKLAVAIQVLEDAHVLHTDDAELLAALVAYARQAGDGAKADVYAAKLTELQGAARAVQRPDGR